MSLFETLPMGCFSTTILFLMWGHFFYWLNIENDVFLQEELAFMYEMLGMYGPALVQYDELDAMFTQYVVNAKVGGLLCLFLVRHFYFKSLSPSSKSKRCIRVSSD